MDTSPILLRSDPFDATEKHSLQFTYTGSQIFAHRLIIKDNSTNDVVYDQKTTAMNLLAEIPANTLVNGNTYNVQVSVFDHADTESPLSNSIVIVCLAVPSFQISNVTDGMIVRNSSLDVELEYSQPNGELLNGYTVFLYDSNKTTIVYTSGTQYTNEKLTARVTGMLHRSTYYLYASGVTVNGMEVHTDFIQVFCEYVKPDIFLKFQADSIKDEGIVRLTSNFVFVEGKSIPEELIYIDDEKVSLINGEKVYWDEGFSADNFTFEVIAENLIDFSKIITFNMKKVIAYVTWNYGVFDGYDSPSYYAELTAYQYIGQERMNYVQFSNRISPLSEGEQVHIWIRHINGTFDVKIAKYQGGGDT